MNDGGEGYLARLAGTKQQHLDLVLRHDLVSPELILDLLIACEWNVSKGVISQCVGVEKETHGLWLLRQRRMMVHNPYQRRRDKGVKRGWEGGRRKCRGRE